MIAYFGSLRDTITADPPEQLRATRGDHHIVQYLGTVRDTIHWTLRQAVAERPLVNNRQSLEDYLRFAQGFEVTEHVRALYLNSANRLLREELIARGTADEAPFYVREIVRRGLDLGATGLILVHNHPSGDPRPSVADKDITIRVARSARDMGIVVHDHLIIARDQCFSFRDEGLL